MKISRVNRYNYAIYEYYNQGFNFGSGDFVMSGQNVCLGYGGGYYDVNYVNPNMLGINFINFIPEEIEVFKVNTL